MHMDKDKGNRPERSRLFHYQQHRFSFSVDLTPTPSPTPNKTRGLIRRIFRRIWGFLRTKTSA